MKSLPIALMLFVALTFGACRGGDAKDVDDAMPTPDLAAQADRSVYTLRILFTGLVALVPTNETENPDGFWALVGNAAKPDSLPVIGSKFIHPHQGLIFVPAANLMEPGREFELGRTPCLPDLKGPSWKSMALGDEDITLVEVPGAATSLHVARGAIKEAVSPGAFDWAVDVETLLVDIVPEPKMRKLREELLQEEYSGALISSRFFFNQGSVFTERFWEMDNGKLETFRFPPAVHSSRAVAQVIALELKPNGPVRLRRKSRSGAKAGELPEIKIKGEAGSTVTVLVQNESIHCGSEHGEELKPDFLFNYNLLEGPVPKDPGKLPRPFPEGDPTDKGQCSPNRYSSPLLSARGE